MVLVRGPEGWVEADLRMYLDEAELQTLLANDPQLIPGCEGAVVAREVTVPGVGAIDLVAVTDDGTITLIECKLAKNPEIRRAVVGQIMAYASGFAGLTFDRFDDLFAATAKLRLLDAFNLDPGRDGKAQLRRAMQERLSAGHFRLVVAVDQITDELRSIIEYMNVHMSDPVSVMALEVGYFKQDGVEVLVPKTYGAEMAEAKAKTGARGNRWGSQAVLDKAESLPSGAAREVVARLLAHSKANDAVVKGGSGAVESAGFYYTVGEQRRSLWSLWLRDESPVIGINIGSVKGASLEVAGQMAQSLSAYECFKSKLGEDPAGWSGRYPEISANAIAAEPAAGDALIQALDAVLEATKPADLDQTDLTTDPFTAG